jgi:hypothetical protein
MYDICIKLGYTIFKIDTGTDTSLKIYLVNLDLEGRGMSSFDQSSVIMIDKSLQEVYTILKKRGKF